FSRAERSGVVGWNTGWATYLHAYGARPSQFSQLSHLEILWLTQDFCDSRLEARHVLCSEGLQVSLIYLVPFRIEEHMMPSDLVALLARSAEKGEMLLGSPRLINPPVAEVLIVHPFDAQHVVHGPADGHRNAHEIDGLLVSQVGPIRDLFLLEQDQVPAIVATVERKRRAKDLKVPVFVND